MFWWGVALTCVSLLAQWIFSKSVGTYSSVTQAQVVEALGGPIYTFAPLVRTLGIGLVVGALVVASLLRENAQRQ